VAPRREPLRGLGREFAHRLGANCPDGIFASSKAGVMAQRTMAGVGVRPEEDIMIAQVGDRLVLMGIHVGDPRRVGVITGVNHSDGTPPYQVRWLGTDLDALVFPGPEAHIEPAAVAGTAS